VDEHAFRVGGMTCTHCATAVEHDVRGVPGVRAVDVRLADGSLRQRATRSAERAALSSAAGGDITAREPDGGHSPCCAAALLPAR
jgi:copper chaperone CopZ